MSSSPEDPRLGSILENRYRIVRKIAVGSMSVVYRGQRLHLRRPVAIKFLRFSLASDTEFLKRFEVEARTMSQLSHPNCISVIDYGVTEAPFIVMEWVRGQTLRELVDESPIDPYRAVHIIRQVLAGLAHAHKRGIVHRDIKPANIMLTEMTCIGDHVCVFDFGLAKLAEVGRIGAIEGDTVAGTLDYMSPEHLTDREVDWRADLFSTGVVFYQLLTGLKPFTASTPLELLHMHDNPPKPLREAYPEANFSPELEKAVMKALAREPEERYQSAIDFAEDLEVVKEALHPNIVAHATSTGGGESPLRRRSSLTIPVEQNRSRSGKWKLFAVVFIVAVAFIFGSFWGGLKQFRPLSVLAGSSAEQDSPYGGVLPKPVTTSSNIGQPLLGEEDAGQGAEAAPSESKGENQPEEPDAATRGAQIGAQKTIEDEEDAPQDDTLALEEAADQQNKPPGMPVIISLIRSGKRGAAISRLKILAEKYPGYAYIHFLLGNLYSEQKLRVNALACYQNAIALDQNYRGHRILVAHVVQALGDPDSAEQAKTFIESEIGGEALPELKRVSKRRYNARLWNNTQELIKSLESEDAQAGQAAVSSKPEPS